MSVRKSKKSRKTVLRSPSVISLIPTVLNTVLDCHNFLAPNEYPEKTFGILAYLLRKFVGAINFSNLMNEVDKRFQSEQTKGFLMLLDDERKHLRTGKASIEECLMLNRLISYIKKDEIHFERILSHTRLEMKQSLVNSHLDHDMEYSEAFHRRKNAQERRRLFYFNHKEVNEPPNLIFLQDSVTKHLTNLINSETKHFSQFRAKNIKELDSILTNSFLITLHPHFDNIPVVNPKRITSGIYQAKISVIIVSLLNDFMQTHPDMIKLSDIEIILTPISNLYKLNEEKKLYWKTCHLKTRLNNRVQIFQFIELSSITIQQTNSEDKHMHFAHVMNTLKFIIHGHVNLDRYPHTKRFSVILETLPFSMTPYKKNIPQMLTRIMLNDIKRFSDCQINDIGTIQNFLRRYFIYRTGVEPHKDQQIYVEIELKRAINARQNSHTLEDIFMDFLVPYVNQIEFMVIHPILSMLYADGLFLGTCNETRVIEIMERSADENRSKIAFRFNSIEIDYKAVDEHATSDRDIRYVECAVRVYSYKNLKKNVSRYTSDSLKLIYTINKFIYKALSKKLSHQYILCNLHDEIRYQPFTQLTDYYHPRLDELIKSEKYEPIIYTSCNLNGEESEDSVLSSSDDDESNDSQITGSSDKHSINSDLSQILGSLPSLNVKSDSVAAANIDSSHRYCSVTTGVLENPLTLHISSMTFRNFCGKQTSTGSTPNLEHTIDDSHVMNTEIVARFPVSSDTHVLRSSRPFNTQYYTHPSVSSRWIQLRKASSHTSLMESALANCAALDDKSLITNDKLNLNIRIICLTDENVSFKENLIETKWQVQFFKDECSCISTISSIKNKLVFLIVSATLANIVIPLVHNRVCVEWIYIQKDDTNNVNLSWKYGYSKVRGIWPSFQEIMQYVERDISDIEMVYRRWSRTPDIFEHLWTQDSSMTSIPTISNRIVEINESPMIVVLCDIQPVPIHLSKDDMNIYEFSAIEDYLQFMTKERISAIFLVIIIDHNTLMDRIRPLIKYDSIHAVYLFLTDNNDQQYKEMTAFQHPKISGLFNREEDLLTQLTIDTRFHQQIPMHTPKMNLLKIENDLFSTLNNNKVEFLNFQFFIDILKQFWCVVDIPSEISNSIEKLSNEITSDIYVNNIQLTLKLDELIKKFNFDNFLETSAYLRIMNQYIECAVQKTYPFARMFYRAQLILAKDLKMLLNNKNSLFSIHTFLFVSESYLVAKNICRRAITNGLTAVLLEINIPKGKHLIYLENDAILFPISTVFKIISIDKTCDNIIHVQLELADDTMNSIKGQMCQRIGEQLTWLTFGNYLAHIQRFDAAEKYFKYLIETFSSDSKKYASLCNNMGMMYLLLNEKDHEALEFLEKAENLMHSNEQETNTTDLVYTNESNNNDSTTDILVKLAELSQEKDDLNNAKSFYEKALKCVTDPTLREVYKLKIEILNIKNSQ